MAHWAKIDNNKVVRVVVTSNKSEDEGKSFVESLGGTWVKTSYNAKIRNKFAAVNDIYDKERDVFISAKPFDSWVLDEEKLTWKAPVAYPGFVRDPNSKKYVWDEETTSWKELPVPTE